MPGKSHARKPVSKAKKKKMSFSQVLLILIVSAIALAFLIFSIYTPAKRKSDNRNSSLIKSSGPKFRKDGSLSIITLKSQNRVNLDIEVADEEGERMRGLMDRLNLPDNAGMLFVFDEDAPRSFWMKNTFISLDIIFINSDKEIVSIQKYTQPQTTTSLPSDYPAQYVLEVNAGFSDNYNVSPGDIIDFQY